MSTPAGGAGAAITGLVRGLGQCAGRRDHVPGRPARGNTFLLSSEKEL